MTTSKKDNSSDLHFNSASWFLGVFYVGSVIFLITFLRYMSCANGNKCITSFDKAKAELHEQKITLLKKLDEKWIIPDFTEIVDEEELRLVLYGQDLIAHTSRYLGPNGSVAKLTNGMNCQNCHLNAGTKIWGNNYGGVASTYPKMRARSGKIEDIQKRVNDCFQRSLNGAALKRDSREMKAIVAYMKFLGKNVQKDSIPEGTGIFKLKYLSRPADPEKGKLVYDAKCASCHGAGGEGILAANQLEYQNPPLWGEHSYNTGAGLYRLSRLAGYVKFNMPYGATFLEPQLSDAESWDVAAYINSQPRPVMDITGDWPDISKKPVDHPFGPFADGFNEPQHKYGPFGPIEKAAKLKK